MLSDDIRARLEALNRQALAEEDLPARRPAPATPVTPSPEPASPAAQSAPAEITPPRPKVSDFVYPTESRWRRDRMEQALADWSAPETAANDLDIDPETVSPAWLDDAGDPAELPAGEIVENASGTHLVIATAVSRLWREITPRTERYRQRMQLLCEHSPRPLHPEMRDFAQHFPDGAIFLDLETCGLSGAMIFLAGIIRHRDGELVLEQLLARDYSEERAMLHTLLAHCAVGGQLITFNGKAFDWPLVNERSFYHRLLKQPAQMRHLDMLHHARRRWRQRVPNCKLKTLEAHLCRRYRSGDIPGREIPAAYHRFVRNGDARRMRSILHHNALDLVTLAELSLTLWE